MPIYFVHARGSSFRSPVTVTRVEAESPAAAMAKVPGAIRVVALPPVKE